MKNLLPVIALCCALFVSQNVFAQNVTTEEVEFKKGNLEFGIGIGILPTFKDPSAKTRILPVSAVLSYRIRQFVSVGAYAGYSSTNGYDTESIFDELPSEGPVLRNDFYIFGGRLEGHFNRERTDFYGGAMISYNFSKITKLDPDIERINGIEIEDGNNGGFKYSGYVGLKYMMTKHLGLFGEIGYGASLINLGITSKF